MSQPRLRVYPPSEGEYSSTLLPSNVRIRLSELFPVLARAYHDQYLWLDDFAEESLLISSDLYEVVQAFAVQLRGLRSQAVAVPGS